MGALVVYESIFGNTAELARAVWVGMFSRTPDVDLLEARSAPQRLPDDVTLLVVGGPTHVFGMTRMRTRVDAAVRSGHPGDAEEVGLREWLDSLDPPERTVHAVAFDTRVLHPHLPGSAAVGARRVLQKAGFETSAAAESFWVTGTTGPLKVGELERAKEWGVALAARV